MKASCGTNVPGILVGCKSDLPKQVNFDQGQSVALLNDMIYFETSAKLNQGVNEAFQSLIDTAS